GSIAPEETSAWYWLRNASEGWDNIGPLYGPNPEEIASRYCGEGVCDRHGAAATPAKASIQYAVAHRSWFRPRPNIGSSACGDDHNSLPAHGPGAWEPSTTSGPPPVEARAENSTKRSAVKTRLGK